MGRPKSKSTKPRKPVSSKRAAANRNYLQETKNEMLQDIFMSHNSQTAGEVHEDHGVFLERAMLRNSLEIIDQEIESELALNDQSPSSLPVKPRWSNGAAAPKKGIRCSVLYCNSRFGSVDSAGKKVTFHRFPSRGTVQRPKWIQAVNMDAWEPNVSSFMCSLHFNPDDLIYFSDTNTVNLKPDAVPVVVPTWSSKITTKNSDQSTIESSKATGQVGTKIGVLSKDVVGGSSAQVGTAKEGILSLTEPDKTATEVEDTGQPKNQPCKPSTPKMPMYCHAVNCCTVHTRESDVKLFSFPLDMERCKQWIINCRRQDFLKMKPGVAHRYYNLCANHFEDHHFVCSKARDCLLPDALPTRFDLPDVPPNLSPEPTAGNASARKRARYRRGRSEQATHSDDDQDSIEACSAAKLATVRQGTDISLPSEVFRASSGGVRLRHAPAQTGVDDVPFMVNKWTMTDRVSTERELYLENRLELCQDLLQKSQRRVEILQEQAAGQAKSYAVEDLSEGAAKYLSGFPLHFFANQLALHSKNKATCNRFPKEVKEFAKAMYAASPKAYRLLSKEFTLPVIRTMQMMARTVQDKIGSVIEEVAGARGDGTEGPDVEDDPEQNQDGARRPYQRKANTCVDPASTSQQPTDMENALLTNMLNHPREHRHQDGGPPPHGHQPPPHPPPPLKKAQAREKHPHHHHHQVAPLPHQQLPSSHHQQPHHHHHHHHHQMGPAVQQQQQQQQHQHPSHPSQQMVSQAQEFMPPHTMSDCLMPMPGGGGGTGNEGYYSSNTTRQIMAEPLFTPAPSAAMLSHPYQAVNNFFFPPDDVQQRSYYYLPTTK